MNMSLERLKSYASISAYVHLGLSIIGLNVFIVLTIVEVASDYQFIETFGNQKLTAVYCLGAGLGYHVLLFCFSITTIIGISRRKNLLLAPFVALIYTLTCICGFLAFCHFISGVWKEDQPMGKLVVTLFQNLWFVVAEIVIFLPVYRLYRLWQKSPPCSKLEEQMDYENEWDDKDTWLGSPIQHIDRIDQQDINKIESIEAKVIYI
ncbi:uncharacterized protein LOC142241227 [Haematobia irritans]|uniref:uncharacterized protein LOC142241227 n=1 Tax=Haematobia irritans TaxID=7368 RepID=UPI003F4FCBFD